jgi:hypothetical protein
MSKRTIFAVIAGAVALVSVAPGVADASSAQSQSTTSVCDPPAPPPMPPASEFVKSVDNIYFPLPPGTKLVYRGQDTGDHVVDKVVVTDETKTILGVTATVVLDRVLVNGQSSEKTFDWYAQDRHGNVWYLGEAAFDFVRGHWVRAEDSWRAGRDGALAGLIMEAHPNLEDSYAQEHLPGTAMDEARVVSTDARISVPYGTFTHALKTKECTPLEPGVVDVKYYGQDVGEVSEATVQGGMSSLVLVSVTHG